MKLDPGNGFKLQDFGHSHHHRPHDRAVEIPAGPVTPYPQLEDGTPDFEDPDETEKRPSLRRRRSVFAMSFGAFSIGALLIVMSSPYSNEFLAPGPLHSSHAQLLAGHGANRCAACHDAAESSTAFGWIAHAFSGASNGMTQSSLCLECHKSTMEQQFALDPHNVDPEVLAQRSSRFKNVSFIRGLTSLGTKSKNKIACSACHREHKSELDLKAMTDAQCQSCHKENYHSFEKDHPEFTSWPNASRQKIAFDHASHFGKHFPSKNAVFDCNRCHQDDNFRSAKIQVSYQKACASCHEQEIVESGTKGFPFVALPMLDMQSIEDSGLDVGTWPMIATGTFDGPLPGAMRTLLMADQDVAPILASRPESFEFADLDSADENDVRDAVALVWSIKKLLYDLAVEGNAAMSRRMSAVLGRRVDGDEVNRLLSGLDARSFQMAARRWLPGLKQEIESRYGSATAPTVSELPGSLAIARIVVQEELAVNPLKQNAKPKSGSQADSFATGKMQAEDSKPVPEASQGALGSLPQKEVPMLTTNSNGTPAMPVGWFRDDQLLAIVYRPAGHEDPFLRYWIDAVVRTPSADSDVGTASLLSSLTSENSVGNCRYCHTLKRQDDRTLAMYWQADRRDASIGSFTSFSHRPHLIQPELQDCTWCHQLDSQVSNKEAFASIESCEYKSNFRSISKSSCVKCHQEGLTSNSCTTCHDYHIGGHKTR